MHLTGFRDQGLDALSIEEFITCNRNVTDNRELQELVCLIMSSPRQSGAGNNAGSPGDSFSQPFCEINVPMVHQAPLSSSNDSQTFRSGLPKRQAEESASCNQDSKRARTRTAEEGKQASLPNSSFLQAPVTFPSSTNAILLSGHRDFSHAATSQSFYLNDQLMRAELEARLLQQEMVSNRNAALMASLWGQTPGPIITILPFFQQHQASQAQFGISQQQQQQQIPVAFGVPSTMNDVFASLRNRAQMNQALPPISRAQLIHPLPSLNRAPMDVNCIVQQLTRPGQTHEGIQGFGEGPAALPAGTAASTTSLHGLSGIKLPPCDEGLVPTFTKREKFPLGIDEDPNWLSEFHCFVRSELVEICRASHDDCKTRNNATNYRQVGIRCRFCAHKPPSARGCRSSAFPSSIRQIYQSFTMMLRDHFGTCEAMPEETKKRFLSLKDKPSQGATDSKRYWVYSAMKAGLTDSPEGIIVNQNSLIAGMAAPPFASETPLAWRKESSIAAPLVTPADGNLGSHFLRFLLSQAQVVELRDAERIGNRRSLEQGLPGFSCRYCWEKRRLGLCRMFPARRRTLAQKVIDLKDHVRRCLAVPPSVKEQLELHREESSDEVFLDSGDNKVLLDRVWARLGHGNS